LSCVFWPYIIDKLYLNKIYDDDNDTDHDDDDDDDDDDDNLSSGLHKVGLYCTAITSSIIDCY